MKYFLCKTLQVMFKQVLALSSATPLFSAQCKFYILQTDRLWLRYNLVLCVWLSYAMGKRRFCSLKEFACNVSTWGAACKLFVAKCGLNLTLYSFEVPRAYAGCLNVGSLNRPLFSTNCASEFEKLGHNKINNHSVATHLQSEFYNKICVCNLWDLCGSPNSPSETNIKKISLPRCSYRNFIIGGLH